MTKPDNPSAFPIPHSNEPGAYAAEPGMSLRDWFAGQALVGMMANPGKITINGERSTSTSYLAYVMADAMLEERAKREGGK